MPNKKRDQDVIVIDSGSDGENIADGESDMDGGGPNHRPSNSNDVISLSSTSIVVAGGAVPPYTDDDSSGGVCDDADRSTTEERKKEGAADWQKVIDASLRTYLGQQQKRKKKSPLQHRPNETESRRQPQSSPVRSSGSTRIRTRRFTEDPVLPSSVHSSVKSVTQRSKRRGTHSTSSEGQVSKIDRLRNRLSRPSGRKKLIFVGKKGPRRVSSNSRRSRNNDEDSSESSIEASNEIHHPAANQKYTTRASGRSSKSNNSTIRCIQCSTNVPVVHYKQHQELCRSTQCSRCFVFCPEAKFAQHSQTCDGTRSNPRHELRLVQQNGNLTPSRKGSRVLVLSGSSSSDDDRPKKKSKVSSPKSKRYATSCKRKTKAPIRYRGSDSSCDSDDDDDDDDNDMDRKPAARTAVLQRSAPRRTKSMKSQNITSAKWRPLVEEALRQVRTERKLQRTQRLQSMLQAKNKLLKSLPSPLQRLQPLVNYRQLPRVSMTDPQHRLDSTYTLHPDHPIPRDSHHVVFLRKHFSSLAALDRDRNGDCQESSSNEDSGSETGGRATPLSVASRTSSDAAKNRKATAGAKYKALPTNNEVKELRHGLTPTKNPYAKQIHEFQCDDRIGVGYEEDELDQDIDAILKRLEQNASNQNRDNMGSLRPHIHEYLAILLQEDLARVEGRWQKSQNDAVPKRQHATRYEDVMSSFRDLFCRRCLIFDCNLHGLQGDYSPDVQLELAVRLENSGYWKQDADTPLICSPARSTRSPTAAGTANPVESTSQSDSEDDTPPPNNVEPLTGAQKELAKRLYKAFQNNLGKVSEAMGIHRAILLKQVSFEPFEFKLMDPPPPSNQSRSSKPKANNYHPEWIKRIVQATSHPFFDPCTHSGPCSETTCSCVQNRFFCTKACVWGASSRNFFRGCNCSGKCTSKICPCFAANRECDPDLCKRCGTCTDRPNKAATTQSCQNDKLGMRRHIHLLMMKSSVEGWGLATKHALKKGDFVHEYLGELISHNEAERRGKIYDENNQTYIFDMSTDYAVDALHKGNKTRYINHSDDPNIGPQMKVVNGDYRIGFFALRDIPAQNELFFNYGDKFFKASGGFLKKKRQHIHE